MKITNRLRKRIAAKRQRIDALAAIISKGRR